MTQPTHSHPFEQYSKLGTTTPPPPPPEHKPKRSKRLLISLLAVVAVLALGFTGVTLIYSNNTEKIAEYDPTHQELQEDHDAAAELLESAGDIEPEALENLSANLNSTANALVGETPGAFSFRIQDRIDELRDDSQQLSETVTVLEEAIEQREAYESAAADAEESLETAQEIFADVDAEEVLDETAYSRLSDQAVALQEALEDTPDETSAALLW